MKDKVREILEKICLEKQYGEKDCGVEGHFNYDQAFQAIHSLYLQEFEGMLPKEWKGYDYVLAPSFRNHECPNIEDLKIYTFGYNACLTEIKSKLEGMR